MAEETLATTGTTTTTKGLQKKLPKKPPKKRNINKPSPPPYTGALKPLVLSATAAKATQVA